MCDASLVAYSNTTVQTCCHLAAFSVWIFIQKWLSLFKSHELWSFQPLYFPPSPWLEGLAFQAGLFWQQYFKPWLFAFLHTFKPWLRLTLLGLDLCSFSLELCFHPWLLPTMTSANTYIRALPATAHMPGRRLYHLDILPAQLEILHRCVSLRGRMLTDHGTLSGLVEQPGKSI